jgi:hypothetical protein
MKFHGWKMGKQERKIFRVADVLGMCLKLEGISDEF